MKRAGAIAALAAGAMLALPASADEVLLHSGGRLMGIATDEGDDILIETTYGTVQLSREMILSIDRTKRSKVEDYHERMDATDLEDVKEVYGLAQWAKASGLSKHAKELFRRAVELDGNHEGARRETGFTLFQGRWMTPEEVMLAKGFVKHRDKWLTPAERELMVRVEVEEAHRREEERRKKEEAKLARQKQKAQTGRQPEWERTPEVIPVIATGSSRRETAPSLGGYGIYPTAGLVLNYDFRNYLETIYKAHRNVPVPPNWYWPFVRPTP